MEKEEENTEIPKLPRESWEEDFKRMHENADDELLIDDFFEDENLEEWD